MVRAVVLDDSRVFAEAVARRLQHDPGISSVVVTGAVDDAVELLPAQADLLVAGLAPALELMHSGRLVLIRGQPPHVIVLADVHQTGSIADAVKGGAAGWVGRCESGEVLLSAVRAVVHGGTWVPPDVLTRLLDALLAPAAPPSRRDALLSRLTDRELQILKLIGRGLSRRDIAEALGLSPNTVRTHIQRILKRLEVHNVVSAVAVLHGADSDRTPPYPPRPHQRPAPGVAAITTDDR